MPRLKPYTEEQEARFIEVLKGIQKSVPDSLRRRVLTEQKKTPVVERVLLEATQTESIDIEKRRQIQNLIDAGTFSKVGLKENADVARVIDLHVSREINKAIKEGRLPPKTHLKYLPSVIKTNEN